MTEEHHLAERARMIDEHLSLLVVQLVALKNDMPAGLARNHAEVAVRNARTTLRGVNQVLIALQQAQKQAAPKTKPFQSSGV